MKKIDVHAHAFPWPELTIPYGSGKRKLSPDELFSQYYHALNVEKAVLLPLLSPEGMLDQVTPAMAAEMARGDDRFFWFCSVDPRAGKNRPDTNLGYVLEHYKALGAKGVGEVTCPLPFTDGRMENLFYHAAALHLPVTLHLSPSASKGYGIVDELGLPGLQGVLRKYPDLVILGHSQPFWSEIGDNVTQENRNSYVTGKVTEGALPAILREYPNLYCDLSAGSGANALMRDREYAARFLEEFSDRVLYGCDICMAGSTFPFTFDAFLTDMVEKGELTKENYRKLVRGNALALLGENDEAK